jgi:hypothetical protein
MCLFFILGIEEIKYYIRSLKVNITNQNKLMEKLKLYEAPLLEVVEMSVEQGFAASPNYDGFDGEEQW